MFREFTLRARVNIKCQVVNGTISAPAGNLHHVGGPEVEEESGARIRPPVSGHHWVQHHLNIKGKSGLMLKYYFDFVSVNGRVCRRNSFYRYNVNPLTDIQRESWKISMFSDEVFNYSNLLHWFCGINP